MTRRRWTLRFAACLGVLTVLISGCTEKQQANETLPSASKTSASESSDELPPLGPEDFRMPDEARTKDAAGAEAALRYYLALITHQAAKSGDPLRDLSRDCSFCEFLAKRADADAAAGYRFTGGTIKVETISRPALKEDLAEFTFAASQSAVSVLTHEGTPVTGRGSPALSGVRGSAAMVWQASRSAWLMSQLRFEQS